VALTLAFGAVGAVFAAAVYFVARSGARSALPRLDAKIADARRKRDEARRLRTIEREGEPTRPCTVLDGAARVALRRYASRICVGCSRIRRSSFRNVAPTAPSTTR
jgi:hypothetical protein